jgi:ppGpp synthetase/RelA/SpoT-type nucleotidyltranferase
LGEAAMEQLTKSQVNKAGKKLRRWALGELTDAVTHQAALDVLLRFRAAHKDPLAKATMGLRSMVRTERCRVEVTQRLKRVPTIIDKLGREPTMQLANMQDVGGCRAVLQTIDEVRRVQKRLAKNRPPLRINDYIATPRASGYRGVHVIVDYDGRAIEVQLRTTVMHEWAITVERLSGRLQADLKSSRGPQPLLDLLEVISEAMALEERGETVDTGLLTRITELRSRAAQWLPT